jgi:hypothetical protein
LLKDVRASKTAGMEDEDSNAIDGKESKTYFKNFPSLFQDY